MALRVDAYNGSRRRGKSRWRGVAAVCAALAASGCSVSLTGFFADEDEATTGSITLSPAGPSPLSVELSVEDWRRAKAALAVALDPQGNGAAASWSNPDSGAKGSISPVGAPYVKDDHICRAFLASTSTARSQDWVQGSACRPSGGDWAVRGVKPWRKPG